MSDSLQEESKTGKTGDGTGTGTSDTGTGVTGLLEWHALGGRGGAVGGGTVHDWDETSDGWLGWGGALADWHDWHDGGFGHGAWAVRDGEGGWLGDSIGLGVGGDGSWGWAVGSEVVGDVGSGRGGNWDCLGKVAWAVGDGQSGSRGDSVGLVVGSEGGWLRAVGGDNIGGDDGGGVVHRANWSWSDNWLRSRWGSSGRWSWHGHDWLADGARAVGDGEGGGLRDGVSLAGHCHLGSSRAVGSVGSDDLGGVGNVGVLHGGGGANKGGGGSEELHCD